MSRLTRLVTFLLAFSPLTSMATDKISVAPVQTVGASKDQAAIVRSLIQNEVSASDEATLVESDADVVLKSTLTKLESSYVLQISKVKKDGKSYSRQVKTKNFDEIDLAAKRVTEAVLREVEVEDTVARGQALSQEQTEPSRVKAIAGWELGLGVGSAFTDAFTETTVLYNFGIGYIWDINYFLLEIRGDFLGAFGNIDKSFSSLTIGGHYVWLDRRNYAIFSGAEFGFGQAVDNISLLGPSTSKGGFLIAADTGVLFLRTSSVNLEARARIAMITGKMNNKIPVVGGLMIGIHF